MFEASILKTYPISASWLSPLDHFLRFIGEKNLCRHSLVQTDTSLVHLKEHTTQEFVISRGSQPTVRLTIGGCPGEELVGGEELLADGRKR
ncbi:hypothetical protein BH10PLA2_BH10PLA2_04420 [soil metagenome]